MSGSPRHVLHVVRLRLYAGWRDGAIVLAAVEPPLITQYAQANGTLRELLQTIFISIHNAVYPGLWNPLEAALAGVWLVGTGSLLWRERRIFGITSLLLGIGALLDAFGNIAELEPVFLLGVSWLVLFFFVWVAWCIRELVSQPELVSIQVQNTTHP